MPWEWARFVHEDPNEGMRDLDRISRLFVVVVDAVRTLPEGRQIDPAWPPEIAELAVIYRDEIDRHTRERAREDAERRKVANGGE